jgi:hypothetical protein
LIISGKKYPKRTGFNGFCISVLPYPSAHNGILLPAAASCFLMNSSFEMYPLSYAGILLSPSHPKPRLREWLHSNVPGVGNAAPVLGILSKLSAGSISGIITAGTE